MSIQRRVRQAANRPQRVLGQRIPGLRPEAADKFKDEVRQYRQARQRKHAMNFRHRLNTHSLVFRQRTASVIDPQR